MKILPPFHVHESDCMITVSTADMRGGKTGSLYLAPSVRRPPNSVELVQMRSSEFLWSELCDNWDCNLVSRPFKQETGIVGPF